MGLADFLGGLFEHGRVRVAPRDLAPDAAELAAADAVLAGWEQDNRLEFPGEPPVFLPSAARWAAQQFHIACGLAVYRDMGPEMVEAALNSACPAGVAASQHYSVDLVFRFLPDLYRFTSGASSDDPLCDKLQIWAREWPLSSVSMAKVTPAHLDVICDHAGLLRLYVDRILAKEDTQRLAEPRVRAAAQAAVGHFAQLATNLTAVLQELKATNS